LWLAQTSDQLLVWNLLIIAKHTLVFVNVGGSANALLESVYGN